MKKTFFNNHKLHVNTTTIAVKQYYSIIFLFVHPCKGNMNDEGVCCNMASAGGEGLRQRGVAKASSTVLGRRPGAD